MWSPNLYARARLECNPSIYLNEDKKGAKLRSDLEHEASVVSEPFNVPFISSVNKYRRVLFRATPESVIH